MSQENVERFVAVAEAFNQMAQAPDEFATHLQILIGGMDSKIQFHPQQAALGGGYAGHEGVMQWLADLAEHHQEGVCPISPSIRARGDWGPSNDGSD